MKSKFPCPTLVFATVLCLLVIPAQFSTDSSSRVQAQAQAQTGGAQSNEIAWETLNFKGSFGWSHGLSGNIFSDGTLTVSPNGLSFVCDGGKFCHPPGVPQKKECLQFASAVVDGSVIRDITGNAENGEAKYKYWRFKAASPAEAARALEAIRQVCGGSSSNSGRQQSVREQKEAAREAVKQSSNPVPSIAIAETQADDMSWDGVAFKGSFGVKTFLFNVFPNGRLIVSPGKLSFGCDENTSCSLCGDVCKYTETLDCSQFASASVDGSAIHQIGAGTSHAHNVHSYRFNAASPAEAARALEAIRQVCSGRRSNPVRSIAIAETRLNQPSPSTGFYAETRSDFDTLDGVTVNASKGTLVLFGHRAGSGSARSVPYLDYLATALESSNPTFSLEWTPQSRQSIERAFNMPDLQLTDNLAPVLENGQLTKRGEWWFRMFGANVRQGMDQMSLWVAVFPKAGYPSGGEVMKAVHEYAYAALRGTANQRVMDADGHPRSPAEHFFNATTGLVVQFDQNFLNTYAGAMNGDADARETLFSWAFQGVARAYKLDENRYMNRYQSMKRNGTDWATAFGVTVQLMEDDMPQVQRNAFHALVGNRTFIHITPDMMRDVLGVSPVVVPVYDGLQANSLLARVAFDADVFGKNLMDMPEFKSDVPSYRTYFEWRQTVDRAPATEGHTWFAPDRFELIESTDGGTVRFGKTPIRIYMERYDRGAGASDRKSVEDPLLKQYADELTALYDPFAAKFPILLDLRESMKVMAIADWLRQKGIKLSLPAAGRSTWNPPAQYPGVIHMEIAVKEAPVGEVMSASGGIDFRVDKNWNLTKQRIEEQPGPPPANATTVDFDPASGVVASARPLQIDRGSTSTIRIGGAGAVRGAVFRVTSDGQKVPIQSGWPMFLNDHIETGPDGHLQVLLLDESVFTLGANSDMVLDEFVYDPSTGVDKVFARLVKGVFRWVTGKVTRQPGDMKIKVGTTIADLRGTDVEVFSNPGEPGYIKLFEGKLEITETKTGAVFSMNAGQMVTVNADGTIGRPVPLPQ